MTRFWLLKATYIYLIDVKTYQIGLKLACVFLFQGFTDDQLMLVEQNTVMVEEREREIRQIVQSISDLNEIFRDLAGMVVEQVYEAVVMCQHTTQHVKMGEVVSRSSY